VRVIRPAALSRGARRRAVVLALAMLAAGMVAAQLALLVRDSATSAGVMAASSAVGLGVGAAWLHRALARGRARTAADGLAGLLAPRFDDSYTLVVAPRLPIRDAARLDGILVGPAGVRVLTVREWDGRYRVRGRRWEFDARGRHGWIPCRTNPSHDATALAEGVGRWVAGSGLGELPLRPAVAFPNRRSRIVLEEPDDEVVTTDNAPWWANSIGRVQRLDARSASRVVSAVLDGAESTAAAPARSRSQSG
jgi:hypothetical protein